MCEHNHNVILNFIELFHAETPPQIEVVWEQSAEEDMWTQEHGNEEDGGNSTNCRVK